MSTPSTVPPATAWTDWLPVAFIALPLAIVDIAVCPLMKAISPGEALSVVVYSIFGMMLAQAGLLTSGLVFARGPVWLRLVVYWCLVTGLVVLWALGFVMASESSRQHSPRVWHELAGLLCAIPALSLGIQLPLWGAKAWLRWNWLPRPADGAVSAGWRLTISDLLIITAVVAGTLAISRLAPIPVFGERPEQQWLMIGLISGSGLGLSLIGLIPLVGIFQIRWPLRTRWGLALGTAFLLASITLVIPATGYFGRGIDSRAIIGFYAVVLWYAVTVCGGLSLVEWRRQREQ